MSVQGTNGYIEPAFAATATSAANLADPLVQTVRLDDLRRPGERVDVLVIDVEGAEGLALRGAERLLTEDRPVIFTEVSPGQLVRTSRMTAEQYFEMFADLGYAFDVVGFDGRTSPFGRDAAAAAGYAIHSPGHTSAARRRGRIDRFATPEESGAPGWRASPAPRSRS
jgi:hypothetical protein